MKKTRAKLLDTYLTKAGVWYNPFTWGAGGDSPWKDARGEDKGSSDSKSSPGGSPSGSPGPDGVSDETRRSIIKDFLEFQEKNKSDKDDDDGTNKMFNTMFMLNMLNSANNSGGGFGVTPLIPTPMGFMPMAPISRPSPMFGMSPQLMMMMAMMNARKSKASDSTAAADPVSAYLAAHPSAVITSATAPSAPVAPAPPAATAGPARYSEADLEARKREIDRRLASDKAFEDDADKIINDDIHEREINRRKWKMYRIMKPPVYAAAMLGGGYLGDKVFGDYFFGNPATRKAGDVTLSDLLKFKRDEKDPSKQTRAEWWMRRGFGLGGTVLGWYLAHKLANTRLMRPEDLSTKPLPTFE